MARISTSINTAQTKLVSNHITGRIVQNRYHLYVHCVEVECRTKQICAWCGSSVVLNKVSCWIGKCVHDGMNLVVGTMLYQKI